MLIIPAIDLQDGCVVRYVQGRSDKKVYSQDPLKTAKHWVRSGAKMLHVVDLDGAFSGKPKNIAIAKEIANNISVPIEFGGGIRDIEAINSLLKSAVSRVILGTRAIEDKNFLKKVFAKFKEKVIVSIDAKENIVATRGWSATKKGLDVISFASSLKGIGFKEVIYTDTLKDGTLSGPNIKAIKELLKKTGLKVVASGGISAIEDLRKLKLLEKKGVVGVIIGKALYEGKFSLSEALKYS